MKFSELFHLVMDAEEAFLESTVAYQILKLLSGLKATWTDGMATPVAILQEKRVRIILLVWSNSHLVERRFIH